MENKQWIICEILTSGSTDRVLYTIAAASSVGKSTCHELRADNSVFLITQDVVE
jgi:hypothetical protein